MTPSWRSAFRLPFGMRRISISSYRTFPVGGNAIADIPVVALSVTAVSSSRRGR